MWKHRKKMWDWRKYLTAEEREFISRADEAAERIEDMRKNWTAHYARERQLISNRAIQRAKYDALTKG